MNRATFGIDDLVGAVRTHIERDAPPAPVEGVAPLEEPLDRAFQIRDVLWEKKNPKLALPLPRLRPRPQAVVPLVKRAFRWILQPFINEVLERQLRFNDSVVHLADEVGIRARELDELRARLAAEGTVGADADAPWCRAWALSRAADPSFDDAGLSHVDRFDGCRRVLVLGDRPNAVVEALAQRGIPADRASEEILRHVTGLAAGSVDGVMAIHVVERLGNAALAEFAIALREALAPGGLAVLETWNASSPSVIAEWYIRDPRARTPKHPGTLRFLCEWAGFDRVEVVAGERNPTVGAASRVAIVARRGTGPS